VAERAPAPDTPELRAAWGGFAWDAENAKLVPGIVGRYPPGRQRSAVMPLLDLAQRQIGAETNTQGWLPLPVIEFVARELDMPVIRVLEVATFYTMYNLAPVGRFHVQVCGTTPCMLRGARELAAVCRGRIAEGQHVLNGDGTLSWEEVECIGVCANAPVVQIGKDTYEDLTPGMLETVIDGYLRDEPPMFGSQTGRIASCPEGGPTTLTDPSLFDGSTVGAWKKRFEAVGGQAGAVESAPASALASPAHKAAVAEGVSPSSPAGAKEAAKPAINPAALAAMANAGLVKELETRGTGKPLSAGELDKLKSDFDRGVMPTPAVAGKEPALLKGPRKDTRDDLGLIWGVGDVLEKKLNEMGIWHFDQIAGWTPENVAWFEQQLPGFKGRIGRDKWIEQCKKLASGWRPETSAGERPKR
jgi:NADH-quinone oxidoreductase subunit E